MSSYRVHTRAPKNVQERDSRKSVLAPSKEQGPLVERPLRGVRGEQLESEWLWRPPSTPHTACHIGRARVLEEKEGGLLFCAKRAAVLLERFFREFGRVWRSLVLICRWPPVLSIFKTSLEKGKFDDDLILSDGRKMEIAKIYPRDTATLFWRKDQRHTRARAKRDALSKEEREEEKKDVLARGREREIACVARGRLDAVYDTPDDVPEDVKTNKRYAGLESFTISEVATQLEADYGKIDILVHSLANGPEVTKPLLETSRKGYLAANSASAYSYVSLVQHMGPLMPPGCTTLPNNPKPPRRPSRKRKKREQRAREPFSRARARALFRRQERDEASF